MALRASINIDADIPISVHDDLDPFGNRVVVLELGELGALQVHFSSWRGSEAVCRALDRLIEPLTELRAKANARLVDEIVADLEAHPLVAS